MPHIVDSEMIGGVEAKATGARGSLEFVENAVLSTTVPLASTFDIGKALQDSVERLENSKDHPLAHIPQRHTLFFDEVVDVYVVLQTPYFDERTLRSYLKRLAIQLEVQVINTPAENHDSPVGQEVIYSGSLQDSEDALIVVQGADGVENNTAECYILVVWKISTPLVRPRLRLQNPSVMFLATADLKAPECIQNITLDEEYLPSQVPSALNMLEAFSSDPTMGSVKPRLSALRVSLAMPPTQAARDVFRPLRNSSRQLISIYPAINAKVRYSRLNTVSNTPGVIASVDIDISPFANFKIILAQVELNLNGGHVEDINAKSGLIFPMVLLPQDDVTFLYHLEPEDSDTTNKSPVRDLEIRISATANASNICQPQISMRWSTALSFALPVNPGYGTPTTSFKRPHRPSQLSINSLVEKNPMTTSLTMSQHDAIPSAPTSNRHQHNPSTPDFGVTISFTSPPSSSLIYPGTSFIWSVFVVNNSERTRKLALMVIPKRRRTEPHTTQPASSDQLTVQRRSKTAEAVLDESIIYAMQKNSTVDTTDIVCLSTDVRAGPLPPLACHEVELKFMALKVGLVKLEAVRVIDLGTQEHVDIKDLPITIVSPLPAP